MERALCRLCLQRDRLGQVLMGGWLLSISEEGLAAVQKHDLEAQLKLHYCVIERVLLFHNHGVFSEPLMTKRDGVRAGNYVQRMRWIAFCPVTKTVNEFEVAWEP